MKIQFLKKVLTIVSRVSLVCWADLSKTLIRLGKVAVGASFPPRLNDVLIYFLNGLCFDKSYALQQMDQNFRVKFFGRSTSGFRSIFF